MTGITGAADAGAPHGSVRVRASLPSEGKRPRWAGVLSFVLHGLVIWLLVWVGIQEAVERGNPLFNLNQQAGGGAASGA